MTNEALGILKTLILDEGEGVNTVIPRLPLPFGQDPPPDVRHVLTTTDEMEDPATLIRSDPPALLLGIDLPIDVDTHVPNVSIAQEARFVAGYVAVGTEADTKARRDAFATLRALRACLARAEARNSKLLVAHGVTVQSFVRFVEIPVDTPLAGSPDLIAVAALNIDCQLRDSFTGD